MVSENEKNQKRERRKISFSSIRIFQSFQISDKSFQYVIYAIHHRYTWFQLMKQSVLGIYTRRRKRLSSCQLDIQSTCFEGREGGKKELPINCARNVGKACSRKRYTVASCEHWDPREFNILTPFRLITRD